MPQALFDELQHHQKLASCARRHLANLERKPTTQDEWERGVTALQTQCAIVAQIEALIMRRAAANHGGPPIIWN